LSSGDALNNNNEGGLPLNETTLAEILKENGYNTAAVGKWYGLGGWPSMTP
jgi:arylsulfatase A-like enzyme